MDLKEQMDKLKAIENDLIVKLEETVNKGMYDEAIKISFLLIKVRKLETL